MTQQYRTVGLITDKDDTAYREEGRDLAVWSKGNNLFLNMIKTKEMIVDYKKRRTKHAPIVINGAVVEQIESFPWGPHRQQTNTVQAHQDSCEGGTTKHIPPQENKKIWHGSSDPQKGFTDAPSRASCLVWQLLGLQLQGTTEGSAYGPVHHQGQTSCHPGPLYQEVSEEGHKNGQTPATLVIDCSLFYRMASGTGKRCAMSRSKRLLNSFYPQAIKLLNS